VSNNPAADVILKDGRTVGSTEPDNCPML